MQWSSGVIDAPLASRLAKCSVQLKLKNTRHEVPIKHKIKLDKFVKFIKKQWMTTLFHRWRVGSRGLMTLMAAFCEPWRNRDVRSRPVSSRSLRMPFSEDSKRCSSSALLRSRTQRKRRTEIVVVRRFTETLHRRRPLRNKTRDYPSTLVYFPSRTGSVLKTVTTAIRESVGMSSGWSAVS